MKKVNPAQFENCESCEICEGECKTIGQVADEFKVSNRTLRFYEQIGLLKPTRDRRKRFYNASHRERISNILKYQQAGMSLHQISSLLTENNGSIINNYVKFSQSDIATMISWLHVRRDEIALAINEFEEALANFNTAPRNLEGE